MRDHTPENDQGFAGLFADLSSGVSRLVQGEFRLARAEAAHSLQTMVSGLVKLAAAAVIALVGLNVLAGAAVAALAAAGLGLAWAALVVGLGLALIALLLVLAGKSALRLRTLKPTRTLDSLQRDADAVAAGLKTEGNHHV